MKTKIVVLYFALLCGLSSISFGNTFEEMSVLDVQNEGAMLLGKKVEVTGTIAYYTRVPGGNAGLYQIRGPYNGQIDVKTVTGEPELNQVYRIQGTIEIDEQKSLFIYEANRMPVKLDVIDNNNEFQDPVQEPPYLAIILIAAGVIVFVTIVVVILILVLRKKQPAIPPMPMESMVPQAGAPASEPSAAAADFEDVEVTIRRDQVVVNTDDRTVRYWPAHFEVIKGSSATGQKIPLCAPGNHVIIGRRKPGKSQGADFIGLEDASRALSGEQCRISQKDDKFILSYAKSGVPNPSKVNGVELREGQELELTDGSEVYFPADPEYVLRFRAERFIPGS